jgi:hypothetical protein
MTRMNADRGAGPREREPASLLFLPISPMPGGLKARDSLGAERALNTPRR